MQNNKRSFKHRADIPMKKIISVLAAILLMLGLIFAIRFLPFNNKEQNDSISEDVLQYEPLVAEYCQTYNVEEFKGILLAMMQQESAGQGTDVFQCSESPFNTQFSGQPNSITDVNYSIQVGVETFAYCLDLAECKSVTDMGALKLALQEYNFGNDYVIWAKETYGGYSEENALEYSERMKVELGWEVYGDPQYVPHVMRYVK